MKWRHWSFNLLRISVKCLTSMPATSASAIFSARPAMTTKPKTKMSKVKQIRSNDKRQNVLSLDFELLVCVMLWIISRRNRNIRRKSNDIRKSSDDEKFIDQLRSYSQFDAIDTELFMVNYTFGTHTIRHQKLLSILSSIFYLYFLPHKITNNRRQRRRTKGKTKKKIEFVFDILLHTVASAPFNEFTLCAICRLS